MPTAGDVGEEHIKEAAALCLGLQRGTFVEVNIQPNPIKMIDLARDVVGYRTALDIEGIGDLDDNRGQACAGGESDDIARQEILAGMPFNIAAIEEDLLVGGGDGNRIDLLCVPKEHYCQHQDQPTQSPAR